MNTNSEDQVAEVLAMLEQAGLGPLISTGETARFLGLKPAAVLRALAAGKLEGVRVGSKAGRWRISAREVARYACGNRTV